MQLKLQRECPAALPLLGRVSGGDGDSATTTVLCSCCTLSVSRWLLGWNGTRTRWGMDGDEDRMDGWMGMDGDR